MGVRLRQHPNQRSGCNGRLALIRLYVANTDYDWFTYLSEQGPLDEVNFWQPGGRLQFRALTPGELFVFRLKSPLNKIAGFGVFASQALLPLRLAWEIFGIRNGHPDLASFQKAIGSYSPSGNGVIGFRVVSQPVFWPRDLWFDLPADWSMAIQKGKTYSSDSVEGRKLWEQIQERTAPTTTRQLSEPVRMFGEPILVRPRLGQGAFRVAIMQAYDRKCAVTQEKTLPALEAAHILPVGEDGDHAVSNGLLLRRDLHALFDHHYITITPEKTLLVSKRIKEEFENGHHYYEMQGTRIHEPRDIRSRPSLEALRRHNELFIA